MDALFSDEIAQLLIAPEDSLDIDSLLLDALNTHETAAKVEISEPQHASSAMSPSHFSSFASTSTASVSTHQFQCCHSVGFYPYSTDFYRQ